MKLLLCLLFVAVAVYAENCIDDVNCLNTVCTSASYKVACVSQGTGTAHECTCVPDLTNYHCHSDADCSNEYPPCSGHGEAWDCKSSRCRCHNND